MTLYPDFSYFELHVRTDAKSKERSGFRLKPIKSQVIWIKRNSKVSESGNNIFSERLSASTSKFTAMRGWTDTDTIQWSSKIEQTSSITTFTLSFSAFISGCETNVINERWDETIDGSNDVERLHWRGDSIEDELLEKVTQSCSSLMALLRLMCNFILNSMKSVISMFPFLAVHFWSREL